MKSKPTLVSGAIIGLVIGIITAAAMCGGCSRSNSQAQRILGFPLPPLATDVHVFEFRWPAPKAREVYISAAISREDFAGMVTRLGLAHSEIVLVNGVAHSQNPFSNWPGALTMPSTLAKNDRPSWGWVVTQTNDADTFFGSLPDKSKAMSDVAFRYENGRFFFQEQYLLK